MDRRNYKELIYCHLEATTAHTKCIAENHGLDMKVTTKKS
jgi:HD superfamily phosphodiesterase